MQRWTHYLLQRSENVRGQRAEHAPVSVDLTTVFGTGQGRRRRSDARVGRDPAPPPDVSALRKFEENQRKHSPWRQHQSIPYVKRGKCAFVDCPGIAASKGKRKRVYDTSYHCEQCSAKEGKIMYFCNNTKGKKVCLCHHAYHKRHCDIRSNK